MAPSSSPKGPGKAPGGKTRSGTARKASQTKLDKRAMAALFKSMMGDLIKGDSGKTVAEFKVQRQDGMHEWVRLTEQPGAEGDPEGGMYGVARFAGPASLLPAFRRPARASAANAAPAPTYDVDGDDEEEMETGQPEERKPPVASTSGTQPPRRSSTPRRRGPARAARPRKPTPGVNDLAGQFDRVDLSTDADVASDAGSDMTHVENVPS